MSFDAQAAFARLQQQHDVLAGAYVEILTEQRRTNELLVGIRDALRLDAKEAAQSFLFWRVNPATGQRERAFDTAAYFADYHSKNGSGAAATVVAPVEEAAAED